MDRWTDRQDIQKDRPICSTSCCTANSQQALFCIYYHIFILRLFMGFVVTSIHAYAAKSKQICYLGIILKMILIPISSSNPNKQTNKQKDRQMHAKKNVRIYLSLGAHSICTESSLFCFLLYYICCQEMSSFS